MVAELTVFKAPVKRGRYGAPRAGAGARACALSPATMASGAGWILDTMANYDQIDGGLAWAD